MPDISRLDAVCVLIVFQTALFLVMYLSGSLRHK